MRATGSHADATIAPSTVTGAGAMSRVLALLAVLASVVVAAVAAPAAARADFVRIASVAPTLTGAQPLQVRVTGKVDGPGRSIAVFVNGLGAGGGCARSSQLQTFDPPPLQPYVQLQLQGQRPGTTTALLPVGSFALRYSEPTFAPAQQLTLWDLQDFFYATDGLQSTDELALCAYVVNVGHAGSANPPADTASSSATVSVNPATLSGATLKAALLDRLAQQVSGVDIRWLAAHPSCAEQARFPVPGSATVTWVTAHGTVVASGTASATSAGAVAKVEMSITRDGTALLRRYDPLDLMLTESLKPSGPGASARASVPLELGRQPLGVTGQLDGCMPGS